VLLYSIDIDAPFEEVGTRSRSMLARRLRRTDYYGWLRGRVGCSMSSDKVRGRGQWNIAGDMGFRPIYRCD
jgi:hypothetical protein